MATQLAAVPAPMTSNDVRHGGSALATFLLTLVKRSLARQGVHAAIVHGGGVRGKRDYVPGPFTMESLCRPLAPAPR